MQVLRKIKRFFNNLFRAFKYAKHGFNSPNWDYHYLERDILFKLKMIRHELTTSGISKPDRITIKSLDTCIRHFDLLLNFHRKNFFKEEDLHVNVEKGTGKLTIIKSKDYELAKELTERYYENLSKAAYRVLEKYRHYWWD